MREKGAFSLSSYTSRAAIAESRGTSTYEGEDRIRQGKGLDPLVDPKGLDKYGPVRGSGNLLVPDGDAFVLEFGVAMPVQTDIDTTGSMGGNVDIAFRVQPKVQNLLIQGKGAVLARYQAQMCTGVVQDRVDQYAYQRSQFEPDNEVERQMGLLYPEKNGGDPTEDYQIGLFAAAYLTNASITKYGLRGYYFSVGDERGRDQFDAMLLKRVFGNKVLELAFEGKLPQSLPATPEVANKLLENWHGFYLQVGDRNGRTDRRVTEWWNDVLGVERVIKLPRTEDLAEVQATIIGLTEGVLDLQSAVDFLTESKVDADDAKRIVDACSGVPVGLQTTLANFGKIPLAGAKFASRDDIWPIGSANAKAGKKPAGKAGAAKAAPKAPKKDWKL